MRLLLSCLLLTSLCALSSWSTPVVTQSPDASVMEGETMIITCCWTAEYERMTLNWLKNETYIYREVFQNKLPPGSLQKETSNCMNLTISSIRREDSGRYTCKLTVEVPFYTAFEGNGTVITVEARENTTDNITGDGHPRPNSLSPASLAVISLAAVAPLLLIILAWFCNLLRRQGALFKIFSTPTQPQQQQHQEHAATSAAQGTKVIYEVSHTDSEVADTDRHSSSSSRGSSQWCQVAVYESFDYFQRVQTKESG